MHMASRKSVGSPTRLASWSGLQEEATMRLDRIKLLKFVSCCGGGGTERQVGNFVRALDPSQLELHLACLNRWGLLDERSEEHTSELQSRGHLVCRLLLEK